MTPTERRLPGQPAIAVVTSAVAACALGVAWWITLEWHRSQLDERAFLLLLCLLAGLILAYHFPIHVDLSSKVYMGSVVLYLIAALLPPAVAATATAVGILAGELSVRQRTGNHKVASIIPTSVARWSLIGLAGSLLAHLPVQPQVAALAAAGIAMWSLDINSGPLLLGPLMKQRPLRIMRMMVREGGVFEAVQYLVGLLGVLEARDEPWTLLLLLPPAALVYLAFRNATQMRRDTRRMFEDIADTVDQRDAYTLGHSQRVADLTREVLRAMGKRGAQLDLIGVAARAHDVGMIGIPDDLARKPGPLTPAERAVMETHAEKGADLFARYSDLASVARIIRHHHEAWDGSGYPHRLKGTEIPFGSRVIAVAESYDAMTSDRPYRPRMTPNHVATILRSGRGRTWDPELVDALIRCRREQIETSATTSLRIVRDADPDSETG